MGEGDREVEGAGAGAGDGDGDVERTTMRNKEFLNLFWLEASENFAKQD